VILVIVVAVMFFAGVVTLGGLQYGFEQWNRRTRLPMDVINPALYGAGILMTMPFVTVILLRANGFTLTTALVPVVSLLGAAVAFGIAIVKWVRREGTTV